jgi:small subunit ribosomal protein S5
MAEKRGTNKSKISTKKSKSNESIGQRKKQVLRKISRNERTAKARSRRRRRPNDEFDVRIVSIRRVSKVKAGGKKLRMSVMVVIGDNKGKIGVALAKGHDVRDAQGKAVNKAKKGMFKIPLRGQTIPHEITQKYGAAKVFLKPAVPGTGVIAGDAVRNVVELAGVKDILSKQLGSNNIILNVYATFEALKNLRISRFSQYKHETKQTEKNKK